MGFSFDRSGHIFLTFPGKQTKRLSTVFTFSVTVIVCPVSARYLKEVYCSIEFLK